MSNWIEETSARAIDPTRVQRALARIAAAWPPEQPPLDQIVRTFPDDAAPLLHLLSISTIAPEKLINDAPALSWLAQAHVARRNRTQREMEIAFETFRANSQQGAGRTPPASTALDERFVALRQWKQREMLRIALREVAGWCTVEQSTLELTQLAEIAVRTVVDEWTHELTRRWGRPETEFAVLAMGKFGGAELNYSSDIDLIFFYGEDGHLNPRFTHQEFFGRLAERVIATFSAHDQAGALFRIDVRLRPEGVSGPLVRSLESMEHYYSGFGETWERMALIKARLVAGSEELGYEFSHRLQPFIFPRSISPDVVEEISAIKQRIEDEIVGQSSLRRNVKLGYGGIREIEFIAQTLQILHGARHAFLQERNTLKTLRALQQLDIIPHQQMEALIDAYRFLRTVEHRLQITSEAQIHTLPDDVDTLQRLSVSLGLQRTAALQAELAKQTGAVRAIFEQVLRTPKKNAPEPELDFTFFQRPDDARKIFAELDGSAAAARFSPRTKKLARKLEPVLLEWLGRVADPDATLTRFVRFVERYGARGLLFETLIRNPRVLELLVRLFDASRFLAEIVFRRPQLVEEVARAGGLGESLALSDYQQGLARNEENLPWQAWVRVYRRAQLLRIGLRDVLAFSTLEELQREYSALAEACLLYVQHRLGLDHALSIVAMGKFGARELTYGADLDVIFIGTEPKGAAEIIRAMTESTAEGTVFPVDARLRPEGEVGPLVTTMEGYEAYFRGRAQLWEAQSLTKARPISGPYREAFLPLAQKVWAEFGKRPGLFTEIAEMHARVQKERTSGGDFASFKTGRGGLMHLEFFVQAHQLAAQLPEPNTIAALALLVEKSRISQSDAAKLSKSYLWLRRVEATLRRFDDKPVSTLPTDPLEQRRLAIRCDYPSSEPFLAEYREARTTIAEICRWEGCEPSPG